MKLFINWVEIPLLKNSDPIEDYSRFLLNASTKGIGCNKENMTNSYLAAAKKLNIDGLIFNQVFGCPSISKTYDTLKDKMKTELNIPSIVINFKKIGENIEQALLNIGRQDIAVNGLNPKESIKILGASSDYLVVDIRDNQFQIGQKLHFDLNYEALLRAMTSPYIHKKFIDI